MKKFCLFAIIATLSACATNSAEVERQTQLLEDIKAQNVERDRALHARLANIETKLESIETKTANAPRRPSGPPPQTAAYVIPTGDSAVLGNKEAKVSVVVFTDLQCPYCSRVHPLMNKIVSDDELKDKVNVVYKHFPLSFHKMARPASIHAQAAREQGDKFFWLFLDAVFEKQRDMRNVESASEFFSSIASKVGLDMKRFEKDLVKNAEKYEAVVQADMKLGQSAAKVRGTPSLFVGGWQLKERSVQGVKAIIKEKKLLD